MRRLTRLSLSVLTCLSSTACLVLPSPPGQDLVWDLKSVRMEEGKKLDIIQLNRPVRPAVAKRKNLLLAIVDNPLQNAFGTKLKKAFNRSDMRVETLFWWRIAPLLQPLYSDIVLIAPQSLDAGSLQAGMRHLDTRNVPYDVALLTHGFHNHLNASSSLISFEDIGKWKSQFKALDGVYMQSCYGTTLSRDWIDAGARKVLAFTGQHNNFFYYEFFLKALSSTKGDWSAAALRVSAEQVERLNESNRSKELLEMLGENPQEYLGQLAYPELQFSSGAASP